MTDERQVSFDSLDQELWALCSAMCDGTIDAQGVAQLGRMTRGNAANQLFCVAYMRMNGQLMRRFHSLVADDIMSGCERLKDDYEVSPGGGPIVMTDEPNAADLSSLPSTHITGFLGGVYRNTATYFSSELSLSMLIATVVMASMLYFASLFNINHYQELAEHTPSLPIKHFDSEIVYVGRITGMKDCQWAKLDTQTVLGASVALKREYALSSGLMEITYTSGAKVILEGPCTFIVDSAVGGYLKQGRLVARVKMRKESRGEKGEISGGLAASASSAKPLAAYTESPAPDPQLTTSPLSTLRSPLFTIATPAAVVTDLGTEFGVEVAEDGTTESHVIQGKVDVGIPTSSGGSLVHTTVSEGNAIRVEAGKKMFSLVPYVSDRFVRRLTFPPDSQTDESYARVVLADKPLGYWPLNEPAYARKFLDRSGNDFHGRAIGDVRPGKPGPLSADSRSTAMDGDGYIYVGRQDRFALPNDFTVEVWMFPEDSELPMRIISADNCVPITMSQNRTGWGLVYAGLPYKTLKNTTPCLAMTAYGVKTEYGIKGENGVVENLPGPKSGWMHVVVVFDRNNVMRFYLNGRAMSSVKFGAPARVDSVWLSIGGLSSRDRLWRGRLAHVAVYQHELSEERIGDHYRHSLSTYGEESGKEGRLMEQ